MSKQKQKVIKKNRPLGIKVRCNNPIYGYEWRYNGNFFIYTTCPSCRKNVKISQNRVDKLQESVQVRGHKQTTAAVVEYAPAVQQPSGKKEEADAS
jgi:hypothetical protein